MLWNLFLDSGREGLGFAVDDDDDGDGSGSGTQLYNNNWGGEKTLRSDWKGTRKKNEGGSERTYFSMTFLRPASRDFHLKTLMSFSMERGLGAGKSMRNRKNGRFPPLETVVGLKDSKLRLIRLFSSVVTCSPTICSTSLIISTEVYHVSGEW